MGIKGGRTHCCDAMGPQHSACATRGAHEVHIIAMTGQRLSSKTWVGVSLCILYALKSSAPYHNSNTSWSTVAVRCHDLATNLVGSVPPPSSAVEGLCLNVPNKHCRICLNVLAVCRGIEHNFYVTLKLEGWA